MNVSSLIGDDLDYWVAKALGIKLIFIEDNDVYAGGWYLDQSHCKGDKDGLPIPRYSREWAEGGPIIEREKIDIYYLGGDKQEWVADHINTDEYTGPTALIAAMRCFVASKYREQEKVK